MADKAHDEARLWLQRIAYAEWHQKTHGNTGDRWNKFAKALAGDFGNADKSGAIDVNMIQSTTQLNLVPLYTTETYITVRPTREFITVGDRTFNNRARARFVEAEANYWHRELRIREKVIRPCVHDAELTNHAYAYIGYVTDENRHMIEAEARMGDDGEEIPGGRREWNPLVKVGSPFVRRMSPQHVLFPPGRCEFHEHPWIALEFRLPLPVVKGQFPNVDLSDLAASHDPYGLSDDKSIENPYLKEYADGNDHKLVRVFQVWNQETFELYTLADGFDRVIDKGAWPWQPEGFPVSHMNFLDVPDEPFASPPVQMYWPQQVELNWARTAAKRRNNMTKAVLIVPKGDTGQMIAEAYASAEDGTVIQVPVPDGWEGRLSDLIQVIQPVPPPSEAYADGQVQMGDILFMTGHGAQNRGSGDPNIATATASAIVDKWGLVRGTDRGSRTKDFILDMHVRLWQILRTFKDVKRDRLVMGPMGARALSLSYTLEELQGEFEFTMDVGALMGDNPIRRQQLAQVNYQMLGADPLVDRRRLIVDLLDAQGKNSPASYLANRDPAEEFQRMQQGFPVEAILEDEHELHERAHAAQQAQLEQEISGMPEDILDETEGINLRLVLAILVTHRNHHGFFVQQIIGAPKGAGGNENMLRQLAGEQPLGPETEAEMGGQPLDTPGRSGLARQVR